VDYILVAKQDHVRWQGDGTQFMPMHIINGLRRPFEGSQHFHHGREEKKIKSERGR